MTPRPHRGRTAEVREKGLQGRRRLGGGRGGEPGEQALPDGILGRLLGDPAAPGRHPPLLTLPEASGFSPFRGMQVDKLGCPASRDQKGSCHTFQATAKAVAEWEKARPGQQPAG